jgi:hypothetical protein
LRFDAPGVRAVEHAAGNFFGHEPFVTANEKAARAARRVADAEVRFPARVGFHHADDGLAMMRLRLTGLLKRGVACEKMSRSRVLRDHEIAVKALVFALSDN